MIHTRAYAPSADPASHSSDAPFARRLEIMIERGDETQPRGSEEGSLLALFSAMVRGFTCNTQMEPWLTLETASAS